MIAVSVTLLRKLPYDNNYIGKSSGCRVGSPATYVRAESCSRQRFGSRRQLLKSVRKMSSIAWVLCCSCFKSRYPSGGSNERSGLLINRRDSTDGQFIQDASRSRATGRSDVMSWADSADLTSSPNSLFSQAASRTYCPPVLTMKPVKVFAVDKKLQDHCSLYHTLIEQWTQLDSLVVELQRMFVEHNRGRTLQGTFTHLANLVAKSQSVSVQRPHGDALCPHIVYDGRDVPYQAIPTFIAFNTSSRLIRQLLGRCPAVSGSVKLVLGDERQLVRDVMVASLGADGPTSLSNCRENIEKLRTVALAGIDEIERRTKQLAAQLTEAADLFGKNNNASADEPLLSAI